MLKSTFNTLLIFFTLHVSAQKTDADTTDYWPTGIRIGTDLISIGKEHLGSAFKGWEGNVDVDFRRYYLTFDYGSWGRDVEIKNGIYSNSGTYYRLGADVNFLLKDPDRNMFFLGMRYAQSKFGESVTYHVRDTIFQDANYFVTNDGVKARWVELTMGLRVKIWRGFWMGYTARLKLLPSIKNQTEIRTYDVPGYGLASKRNYYGFNYQIFWRIPIRKDD